MGADYIYKDIPRVLRALDNPHRIQMLYTLAYRRHTVGELADAVGLRQSAASYHLEVIRSANLLVSDGGAGMPSSAAINTLERFIRDRLAPKRPR